MRHVDFQRDMDVTARIRFGEEIEIECGHLAGFTFDEVRNLTVEQFLIMVARGIDPRHWSNS